MGRVTSVEFANMARLLALVTRIRGYSPPIFRSPPRNQQLRSIRRNGEQIVVAVRLGGRSRDDVITDMVDGIVSANQLDGNEADLLREALIDSLKTSTHSTAA